MSPWLGDPALPWGELSWRLLGALVPAGLVGIEREMHGKAAGLRTHMLVGLACGMGLVGIGALVAALALVVLAVVGGAERVLTRE